MLCLGNLYYFCYNTNIGNYGRNDFFNRYLIKVFRHQGAESFCNQYSSEKLSIFLRDKKGVGEHGVAGIDVKKEYRVLYI